MTHYNLGNALKEQGKLEEAIACHRRALYLKPDDYLAHVPIWEFCFRSRGNWKKRSPVTVTALSLNPDNYKAHNNLGNALQEQGKLEEAIACYRRCFILKP